MPKLKEGALRLYDSLEKDRTLVKERAGKLPVSPNERIIILRHAVHRAERCDRLLLIMNNLMRPEVLRRRPPLINVLDFTQIFDWRLIVGDWHSVGILLSAETPHQPIGRFISQYQSVVGRMAKLDGIIQRLLSESSALRVWRNNRYKKRDRYGRWIIK